MWNALPRNTSAAGACLPNSVEWGFYYNWFRFIYFLIFRTPSSRSELITGAGFPMRWCVYVYVLFFFFCQWSAFLFISDLNSTKRVDTPRETAVERFRRILEFSVDSITLWFLSWLHFVSRIFFSPLACTLLVRSLSLFLFFWNSHYGTP